MSAVLDSHGKAHDGHDDLGDHGDGFVAIRSLITQFYLSGILGSSQTSALLHRETKAACSRRLNRAAPERGLELGALYEHIALRFE